MEGGYAGTSGCRDGSRAAIATAHVVAALLALSVQVLLGWLLLWRMPMDAPVSTTDSARIQVRWTAPASSVPVAVIVPVVTGEAAVRRPSVGPPKPAPALSARPIQAAPAALADDTWPQLPEENTAARTASGEAFHRDLFARHGDAEAAFATRGHLHGLKMRDSSLGGWMQRESQRRACGELRVALREQTESTAAMLASMRRWGCGQ